MKTLKRKLTRLEKHFGTSDEAPPTVFVFVTDASVPDPEDPTPAVDYSEEAIIGARVSRGNRGEVIPRKTGEKMEAFKKRLTKSIPNQRLFFMSYLHEATAERD